MCCRDLAQSYSPLDGKTDEQIEEQARADLAQRAERQKRNRPESDVPINDQIEYVPKHLAFYPRCPKHCPLSELWRAV